MAPLGIDLSWMVSNTKYLALPAGSASFTSWLSGNPVQGTVIAQVSTQRCR